MGRLTTFITLALLAVPLTSHAFVKKQMGVKINAQKELQTARALNFSVSRDEDSVKDELEELKRRNKKMFQAELKDGIANTSELQSYLQEVRDGRSRVERAKLIAKAQLYKAVERNWKDLRNTILNEMGATNWKQFEPYLRDLMRDVSYIGPKKGTKNSGLEFHLGNWGRVTVYEQKGKPEKVDLIIAVRAPHDDNTLPSNFNDIRVQGEEEAE